MIGFGVVNRGVMIPGQESIPESDFHHFSEIYDSDSNSDSSNNPYFYCTGIDSGYRNRVKNGVFIMAHHGIPEKTES